MSMDVKKYFGRRKINHETSKLLNKKKFPTHLRWLYELLLYFPLKEQTAREKFYLGLSKKVKAEIRKAYLEQNDAITDWLADCEDAAKYDQEKVYASDIFEIQEENYEPTEEEKWQELSSINHDILNLINENPLLEKVYNKKASVVQIAPEWKVFSSIVIMLHGRSASTMWKSIDDDLKYKIMFAITKGSFVWETANGPDHELISKFKELQVLTNKYFSNFTKGMLGL